MSKLESNVEDWMMTGADVRRLRNHLLPVLEKHKLADGVRFGLALRETWGAYLYVPADLCTWPTVKNRLRRVCAEIGLDSEKVINSRPWNPQDETRGGCTHFRFTLPNVLVTAEAAKNYINYCDCLRKARRYDLIPKCVDGVEEPWRRIDFVDDEGTVYEHGVILPKQDPNASDTAIIRLSREFLVYHQDEGGFGEIRDYTPYYAKKFLTRPIKKVKILYGHQAKNNPKNKWVLWELDKLEVEVGEKYMSPYRADGTLKTRADYGTDQPITSFHLSGHKQLAGTTERVTFEDVFRGRA